jgi:hypothetical protein
VEEGASDRGTNYRPANPRPEDRPEILDTGKGRTVVYRGRALYSRYDPSRDPAKAAANLAISGETLVLCVSPLLGYGLDSILEKLPENGLVLALESDERLMSLSVASIDPRLLAHERFRYARTSSASRVVEYLDALALRPFRRCVRIDLSAGASLDPEFYGEATRLVDEYISRYWRNHVTLMRLGRSYARDFFANLPALCGAQNAVRCAPYGACGTHGARPGAKRMPRPIARGMAGKPVLVAGAGPSLDGSLDFIRRNRESLFVLAVDTALGTLVSSGVGCDAVAVVESQFWIERAFAGMRDSRVPVFADLTARPAAVGACSGDASFFLSEYARTRFLERFLPALGGVPVIQPLGSVGLVALCLARIVASPDSRVLFTGLDFSFGGGYTHSRGAPASIESLFRANRLAPLLSSPPSLAPNAGGTRGKDGSTAYTDPSLSGYASLCASFYSGVTPPFMDIGSSGLDTGLPRASPEEAEAYLAEYRRERGFATRTEAIDGGRNDIDAIGHLLREERDALVHARGIMTGEIAEEYPAQALEDILRERDYLYLHFPDGYRGFSADAGFLRRVRVEIDYFLKTISNAIAEL